MSYASQQPPNFKNYVENIAIVGAGGNSGSHMVEMLLKTGKHKITAISRIDSTSKLPSGIAVKHVDYNNQASLAEALENQDVLIITMGAGAPKDQQTKLIEAAATAKVPWVLPNEFGNDNANEAICNDVFVNGAKTQYRELIEKSGVSSWIGFCCNFWYEFSLSFGSYGIDIKNRTAKFYDDGTTRLNTTTFPQVGRGVANLLSLKVLPDDENDESPCLSNFKNKFVYVSSFCINQREMLDSLIRVTDTNEKDWKIEYCPLEETWKEAKEKLEKGDIAVMIKNGDFGAMMTVLYGRSFFKDNAGNYEKTKGLQNDALGLPKENLDEFTKIAVERVKRGITWGRAG